MTTQQCALFLLSLTVSIGHIKCFQIQSPPSSFRRGIITRGNGYYTTAPKSSSLTPLSLSLDDDDDEDEVDTESLGDWRQFRMNLAQTGLPGENDDSGDDDGSKTTASTKPQKRPKSVSRMNEAVLLGQNEELAKEYLGGVWAHDTANAEVGGLVCRMPLEAEIRKMERRTAIGRKLREKLSLDDDDDEDEDSISYKASPKSEETLSSLSSSSAMSFSPLAANTAYWYRGAQSVVKSGLKRVTDNAEKDGQIDPSRLDEESIELLQLYLDYQETWQEVCMVINHNEEIGTAATLVLNRPMAMKLNDNLAKLILFGAKERTLSESDVSETYVRFMAAFKEECALYVGGPDCQDEAAVMVHGIKKLEGAVEISPGCGIYKGGLDAAISGVMRGDFKALDFRFFVGRHRYTNQELDKKIVLGKYQPVACARSLALKQCIALPKPLWHEVLELCGGELKEISSLEYNKRTDIEIDDSELESGWDDDDEDTF